MIKNYVLTILQKEIDMHLHKCRRLCFPFFNFFYFVEVCELSISSDSEQHREELNSSVQVSAQHSSLDESVEWKKVDF